MSIPKPVYKATLGDRVVPIICNWLLRSFTSDLYFAWVTVMMERGRKSLDVALRDGDV